MLEKFEAFQLAKKFYKLCKQPKIPPFLKEQLIRAGSSIVLNLAEGSGKRTPIDQRRFYAMAFGSLRECQAILEIEEVNSEELKAMSDRLGAMLFKLSRKPIPTENQTVTKNQTVTENRTATENRTDTPNGFGHGREEP